MRPDDIDNMTGDVLYDDVKLIRAVNRGDLDSSILNSMSPGLNIDTVLLEAGRRRRQGTVTFSIRAMTKCESIP